MGYHGASSPSWTSGSCWPPLLLMFSFWNHDCSSNSQTCLLNSGIVWSDHVFFSLAQEKLFPCWSWISEFIKLLHTPCDWHAHQRIQCVWTVRLDKNVPLSVKLTDWHFNKNTHRKPSTKKARERQHGLAKTDRKKQQPPNFFLKRQIYAFSDYIHM